MKESPSSAWWERGRFESAGLNTPLGSHTVRRQCRKNSGISVSSEGEFVSTLGVAAKLEYGRPARVADRGDAPGWTGNGIDHLPPRPGR